MATFFHNIYSLLFLFCILFIVATQIAASRRKNLKSDVWTLWLDKAIWSLSQKGKLDFSILPIDVSCYLFYGYFLQSCSKKEIIFICVCFCLNTCIMRVVLPVYEFGQMSRLDLSCPISSKYQPTTKRI
jgi:hypothetical protein